MAEVPNRATALRRLLAGCSQERIHELAKVFNQCAKDARWERARALRKELKAGDEVSFPARDGSVVKGKVLKIMKTRASVNMGGKTWRVPLDLIKKES